MLESKTTQQPDAIEKIFCEPFEKLAVRPMTEDESAVMLNTMGADMQGKGDDMFKLIDEELPMGVQMIQKSLKYRFTFDMADSAILMLASVCDRVGVVIMYLTYLQYRAKKMDKRKLNVKDLAEIFPMGFPTEDALHKIWDAQKVKRDDFNTGGSDNLLDYQGALKSIHFETKKSTEEE